jgi:hypothetical protein
MPTRQDSTWMAWSEKPGHVPGFLFVRPAGRTLLEVKVLYGPDTGNR